MTIDVLRLAGVGVRRTPAAPLAMAGCLVGVGVIARAASADEMEQVLPFARLSAIVVAAAATWAIDDPAAPLVDATWRGRYRRTLFVLVPTAIVAAVAWGVPAIATRWVLAGPSLPIGGLLLELVGLMAVGWLVTAAIAASFGTRGAPMTGAAVLMVTSFATMSVPRTNAWLWRPPDPEWFASHVRWAFVVAGATITLGMIWRDPAR